MVFKDQSYLFGLEDGSSVENETVAFFLSPYVTKEQFAFLQCLANKSFTWEV